jgi:hypothetical protein
MCAGWGTPSRRAPVGGVPPGRCDGDAPAECPDVAAGVLAGLLADPWLGAPWLGDPQPHSVSAAAPRQASSRPHSRLMFAIMPGSRPSAGQAADHAAGQGALALARQPAALNAAIPAAQYIAVVNVALKAWADGELSTSEPATRLATEAPVVCCGATVKPPPAVIASALP